MTVTRVLLLLLAASACACSVRAVVIKNGAPCLEGRVATSSADIQKDDWACFVFCSGGPAARRTGVCRQCCLDPGQAVDTGTAAEPEATSTLSSEAGESATKERTSSSEEVPSSTAAAEASTT